MESMRDTRRIMEKEIKREVHRFDLKKSVLMKPAIRRLFQEKKSLRYCDIFTG